MRSKVYTKRFEAFQSGTFAGRVVRSQLVLLLTLRATWDALAKWVKKQTRLIFWRTRITTNSYARQTRPDSLVWLISEVCFQKSRKKTCFFFKDTVCFFHQQMLGVILWGSKVFKNLKFANVRLYQMRSSHVKGFQMYKVPKDKAANFSKTIPLKAFQGSGFLEPKVLPCQVLN